MSLMNNISKDVSDSITGVLGEGASLNLRRVIRVEIRPDKLEPKALVLSDHRLYIFSNKCPSKLELSFHFLELKGISSSDNKLTFTTEARKLKVFLQDAKDVDHIIFQLSDSLLQVFPHLSLESLVGKLEISPPERLKKITEQMKEKKMRRESGPCGNFSVQYRCMCDLHNMPYLDEVAWDVDTIYLALNSKALLLSDFDHLDGKHLVPIIATMAYNNWFTTLCGCDVKMIPEAQTEFADVTRTNTSIEHYCLMNSSLRSDFVQKMSPSLAVNTEHTSVTHFLFNGNSVEDKGLLSLCPILSALPKGAASLKFAKCGLTQKSVNKLAEALINNTFMLTSLQHLDLSANTLKEDITNLCNFLATPNALVSLNLSGTECALDNIFGALIRGCCTCLVDLDLSGNVFSSAKKKTVDAMVPVSWKQFFASAMVLKKVNLADNKLPIDAIKNLMLGISTNENLRDVALNLSNNNLGVQGGSIVETCMAENTNIAELDISDNNLEGYLAKLLETLSRNTSLKKLAIGKNVNNLKQKQLVVVLESVVNIMQEEDSALESLSLADSKLKQETAIVVNALGGNTKLTELDISGNFMGDIGARLLAKALYINNKLRTIYWDCNNTMPQGFTDVSYALKKNFTVQQMPIPVQDLHVALRMNREKTEKAIHSIESSLQRNNSPHKFGAEQNYRLQHSFLMSTTQELVDKYMVDLLDSIGTLEKRGEELSPDVQRDIAKARDLMKDAENSRQLLLQLQKISSKCDDDSSDVSRKLKYMTDDLQVTLERYLKGNVSDMLKVAQARCVTLMQDRTFTENVRQSCMDKARLPDDFSDSVLIHQAGPEVYNKLSEVNLTRAFHISETLYEKLLEALNNIQKDLIEHIRKGESGLDELARISIRRSKFKSESTEASEVPKSRKSIYSVRVRPQSHAAPPEISPTASGVLSESAEDDLDSFVFVETDDVGKNSNDVTQQSGSEVTPTVTQYISVPKSPPPRKPPPPKVVKAPSTQAGAKYVYPGKELKPERGDRGSREEGAEGEPSAPPRRKHHGHVKKDSDSSVERMSTVSHDSVAGVKIENSPQLIAPPDVVKSADKRHPPERPHERPAERASALGPKSQAAPPRPPPAKPNRPPSIHLGSVDKSPVTIGHLEKSPRIPDRPGSQGEKAPHIPERPNSQTDKMPVIPVRPGLQRDKTVKSEQSDNALKRSGNQTEQTPTLPERPPPLKPVRLSAAFTERTLVKPVAVTNVKALSSIMKDRSPDEKHMEKKTEKQTTEASKAKAIMIQPDTDSEAEEPDEQQPDTGRDKEQDKAEDKEDVSESDVSADQTDSLSTSVDSLLEDSRESTPSEKSSPKSKPKSKKKEKEKPKVAEFDSLSPLTEGSRLSHLTKNRPKRMATAKPSRAVIKSEAYVIEDIGGADMDGFFGSKPVAKEVISRENSTSDARKPKEPEKDTHSDDKADAKSKKGMKPLFGGIDIRKGFSKLVKSSPKSPENKPVASTPEEVKKSREASPIESPHSKSPAKELEEEKEEAKAEVKPLQRRPPGAIGMPGLGGPNLLAEMRLKRSTMIKDEPKDKSNDAKDKENSPQRDIGGTAPPKPFHMLKPIGRLSSDKKGEDDKPPPPVKPKPLKSLKPISIPPPQTSSSPRNSQTKPPEESSSTRPQSMLTDRSRLNQLLQRDAEKHSTKVTENGKNNDEKESNTDKQQFEVYL